MAAVVIHGNPFVENVWERKVPVLDSKHRLRPETSVKKTDTIVTRKDEMKDDYHPDDYCVIKAASKGSSAPRRPPVLVSDRACNLRLSSQSYRHFVQRHTQGNVYEPPKVINSQPRAVEPGNLRSHSARDQGLNMSKPQNKQYEEDINLFCCDRTVDSLIERGTCVCCVKAALYHCTKDSYEEGSGAEHPCVCGTPSRSCVSRWGVMALCSIFLPCVLCYLPLKGCTHIATDYKKHRIASRQRWTEHKERHQTWDYLQI